MQNFVLVKMGNMSKYYLIKVWLSIGIILSSPINLECNKNVKKMDFSPNINSLIMHNLNLSSPKICSFWFEYVLSRLVASRNV